MDKLPSELKHNPILEAIFELRFEPGLPNEAVFGAIYPIAMKNIQNLKAVSLPLLQLPETIRNNDPKFKYQPINRLQDGNISVNVGPRVISFSATRPYNGWTKWKAVILNILKSLSEGGVIKNVERTGLRYINFFDGDVFSLINAQVTIINTAIKPAATAVRAEIIESEYVKTLQLANNATVHEKDRSRSGSLIDIDVARNKKITNYDFQINIDTVLNKSHAMATRLFFEIIKEDLLNQLEPVYGEVNHE